MNARLFRGDAPSREVPRKRAAVEHFNHAALIGGVDVPSGQVAVEGALREHAVRHFQTPSIPLGNVSVEARTFEHGPCIFQGRNIPAGNVAVEFSVEKHAVTLAETARVPLRNVSIERTVLEHTNSLHHALGVPLGDVAIEGRILEHLRKVHKSVHENVVQIAFGTLRANGFAHQIFEALVVAWAAKEFHGGNGHTAILTKKRCSRPSAAGDKGVGSFA